jgi:hypothetical protein
MINKINKKGATYGGWIEVILFIMLFVGVLAVISISMNSKYGSNHDLTMGIATNSTTNSLKDLQVTLANSTKEGQSSFSSLGIFQLTTIPRMMTAFGTLLWDFVTGSFINSIVESMNLGDYSAIVIVIFKLLYFITLILILIKIITRVVI